MAILAEGLENAGAARASVGVVRVGTQVLGDAPAPFAFLARRGGHADFEGGQVLSLEGVVRGVFRDVQDQLEMMKNSRGSMSSVETNSRISASA